MPQSVAIDEAGVMRTNLATEDSQTLLLGLGIGLGQVATQP